MATILSLRTADGREFPVTGVLRIGRAADSEISLLADDLASRLHARVWPEGDRLLIRDEDSSNGTHVNGRALAPAETYRLRPGDTVRVGGTTFTVAASSTAAQPSAVPAAQPALAPAAQPATTRIESAPALAAPASNRGRNLLIGGCLVLVVLVICAGLGFLGARAGGPILSTALAQANGPATPAPGNRPTPTPGPGAAIPATPGATSGAYSVQVLPTLPPPTPLAPAAYSANSLAVAAALADLNKAQLQFIHDTQAGAPPGAAPMNDLLTVAADSFKLGLGAETVCNASAVQAGGSPAAGQVAVLYAGLAKYGYAQALDAQNLRLALASGALDLPAAAARVADFGARAWNPSVADPAKPGNPFLPFVPSAAQIPLAAPLSAASAAALQTSLGAQASLQTWIAAPAQTLTRTVALPRPLPGRPLDDPQDPALLASLITASGQADGNRASQAAAAGLQRLGATLPNSTGGGRGTLLADFASQSVSPFASYEDAAAVIMSDDQKPGGSPLPAFPGGAGAALAKGAPAANGDDAFINNVFDLDTGNTPAKTGDTPITAAAPLVTFTIGNPQITQLAKTAAGSLFEARVNISFDVTWQTNLLHPQLSGECNQQSFPINATSGTAHLQTTASLILYPGRTDLYCVARNQATIAIGSGNLSVLVGDEAAATARAHQVETESAALDLTLTADAQRTATEAARLAGQTQSALQTQNALETEQAATQTAEFRATITEIAHLTAIAVPLASDTPSPTPTFVPVLLETLVHPGDQFAVSTRTVLQPNRLYQFCFSGTVNLINPDRAAKASDIDHVNGVGVPLSGCMVVEGNGKVAVISCGSGEVAQDPGGFTIQVVDLGPA